MQLIAGVTEPGRMTRRVGIRLATGASASNMLGQRRNARGLTQRTRRCQKTAGEGRSKMRRASSTEAIASAGPH